MRVDMWAMCGPIRAQYEAAVTNQRPGERAGTNRRPGMSPGDQISPGTLGPAELSVSSHTGGRRGLEGHTGDFQLPLYPIHQNIPCLKSKCK